jgi:hypothetical protein
MPETPLGSQKAFFEKDMEIAERRKSGGVAAARRTPVQ